MAFTHIVTFKWRADDVADDHIADALRDLAARLDVQSYVCGPDAGFTPNAYDFAVVATFDTPDRFVAYRDHPEHQRILQEMILPNLQSRTFVQLDVR